MRDHASASARWLVDELELTPGTKLAEFDSHHGGSWLPALTASGLVPTHSRADLVVDVHGIAHEEDLAEAMAQRVARLAPGGLLVFEFHHLLALLTDGQFDTVRHGHPVYLSMTALEPLLARFGLAVLHVRQVAAFGGSLVLVAGRQGDPDPSVATLRLTESAAGITDRAVLCGLQRRADLSAAALRTWLERARADGRRTLGYGAPSKAAVLLTYAGVGTDLLPFTADLSPAKHGRRIPGVGIPIRSPAELLEQRPDDVLVLTWDIAEEVRQQLRAVEDWGGRFVLPLPSPHPLR